MSETIAVKGMTCEHCEQTVEEALEDIEGVTSATADRDAESAAVEGSADVDKVVNAVNDAGYDASA
ncbi:heavy-metal-associated domain-containing protein (plasmid) [Natrinema zhouii]|uniref:heavy-metal-associated domain-containing protein n=1 Tax=Natrinema zhouii TaxID=1710539 RepID=UPI001CFFAA6F|nr:heavy metal-associated domain-containing protein [Natrinema zhouii]UHQ99252.1 heavy-metal-associated domain-containing protein [Natrinema zhouii]